LHTDGEIFPDFYGMALALGDGESGWRSIRITHLKEIT